MTVQEMLEHIEYEEVVTCPVCRETDKMVDLITDVQVNRPSQAWRICLNCEHTFVSPRPTEAFLKKFYTDGYREMVYRLKEPESPERIPVGSVNEERHRSIRVSTMLFRVKERVANHLDVGSSTGALCAGIIDMLSPKVSWGVEPNEAWRKFSEKAFATVPPGDDKKGEAHFVPTLTKVPKTLKFELVTLIHTLEHLREPRGLLEQCRDRMRPSGIIAIEVPNRYGGLPNPLLWPHLHCYTEDTLKRLVESVGFCPLLFETFGNHPPFYPPPQSIVVVAAMQKPELSMENVLIRYNLYRNSVGHIQGQMAQARPSYEIG